MDALNLWLDASSSNSLPCEPTLQRTSPSDDGIKHVKLACSDPLTPDSDVSPLSIESDVAMLSDTEDITVLLCEYAARQDESALREHGLRMLSKLHDGLQGDLYAACSVGCENDADNGSEEAKEERVVVKKVEIALYKQRAVALDGMIWCVPKDVVKEGLILHYLTVKNRCIGDYIVQKRDFFSSAQDYYLVTQDAQGVSLANFVENAHQKLRKGLLKHADFVKIIKYIFWQLCVFLNWMHHDMSVCHLDLKPKHIILQDAEFTRNPCTGRLHAAPKVKVVDFGSAELFRNNQFACWKECSPLSDPRYQCPRSYEEDRYDARLHDMWAVGVMLAECLLGRPLFETRKDEGFLAVRHRVLNEYFELFGLDKFVNTTALDFLNHLLDPSEARRFLASDALQHKWFKSYYAKFRGSIDRKSQCQTQKLESQSEWISRMPAYMSLNQ